MAVVTFGLNFGQNTAAPEGVTEAATSSTNDVAVYINTTNLASTGQSRGEIERMVNCIMRFILDGRQASIPGL